MPTQTHAPAYRIADGSLHLAPGLSLTPRLHGTAGGTPILPLQQAPDTTGTTLDVTLAMEGWDLRLCVHSEQDHHIVRLDCARAGDAAPAALDHISWTIATDLPSGARCQRLPADVWGKPAPVALTDLSGEWAGWWRCAIAAPGEQRGLFCGWRLPASGQHRVEWRDDRLVARSGYQMHLQPGDLLTGDPLAIATDAPLASALAGPPSFRVARRTPDEAANHRAYNTWDYYRLTVRAVDVERELAAITGDADLRARLRYVVIDDGWQTAGGDWQANDRFPDGMEAIAGRIRDAGLLPGIWTAPFMADLHSDLAKAHPDWFVRTADGTPYSPWGHCDPPWGDRHMLDPTHPGVRQHLFALYSRLRAWGYRYFKTDFLVNPLKNAITEGTIDEVGDLQFHDRSAGLLRAHRACMQTIRAAIGEDSFWLGCGSLWATGAGLMDASRVSSDIHAAWPQLEQCATSIHWGGALHGALWLNDPDFLVVRGPETSNQLMATADAGDTFTTASHGHSPSFTADEARVWASLVAVSGGMAVLSDSIAELNDAGRAILRTVLPYCGGPAAVPLDADRDKPGVLLAERIGGELLACINWAEAEKPACTAAIRERLPQARWHEVWSGRELATGDLTREILRGHQALLLRRLD